MTCSPACAARTSSSPSSRATAGSPSRTRPSRRRSTPCSTPGPATLRAAGFDSRSAFLTSPTFGGISWLAHSTLQSGLWVDSQQRYDQLVASDRFTLSDAFQRAGWRTVGDVPANRQDWPEGSSFYHYDQIYDAAQRRLRRAEVQLRRRCPTSTPSPPSSGSSCRRARPPAGDGRDRPGVEPHALGAAAAPGRLERRRRRLGLRRHARQRRVTAGRCGALGGRAGRLRRSRSSTRCDTLVSFVQTLHDDNLVLVVLGDHQPARDRQRVGREPRRADHDHRARPGRAATGSPAWGWQDGLRPGPSAPVWPMDAFRDQFFTAYGPQGATLAVPVYRAAH